MTLRELHATLTALLDVHGDCDVTLSAPGLAEDLPNVSHVVPNVTCSDPCDTFPIVVIVAK